MVDIGRSGIRETLSTEKRYVYLPMDKKRAKLAVLTKLPEMIKFAEVENPGENNRHGGSSKFLVLKHPATIDGKEYSVTLRIKLTPQKNKFYIHDMTLFNKNKNETNSSIAPEDTSAVIYNAHSSRNGSVAESGQNVKAEFESKHENNTRKSLEVDSQGNELTEAQQVPVLDEFFNALDNAIDNRQRMLDGDTAQKNSAGEKSGACCTAFDPTDRGGNSLNILKVASAYGKDTNPQGLIDNSKILYVEPNKKRTQNWLSVNRLQLPLPSSSYGFINTIVANKPSGVNTHSMQNGQKNAQNGKNNTRHSLEVDSQGNELTEAQQVPVLDGDTAQKKQHRRKNRCRCAL